MAAELSEKTGQTFHLIRSKDELNVETLEKIHPTHVFFPHWSYIIPESIFSQFSCVIFHMTDVPYGRGGSPLQNLIARGHTHTKMTALQCVKELDAGPVFLKYPLCLNGSAEEIFLRAANLVKEMIVEIVTENPVPQLQNGEVTNFTRRTPAQSEIIGIKELQALYDHIRMLDADGYPKAYLELDGFKLEFSRAALKQGRIEADVVITKKEDQ